MATLSSYESHINKEQPSEMKLWHSSFPELEIKKRKALLKLKKAKIKKNNDTLLSSTSKLDEGNKVPLFFRFLAYGLRYGHFVILYQPRR